MLRVRIDHRYQSFSLKTGRLERTALVEKRPLDRIRLAKECMRSSGVCSVTPVTLMRALPVARPLGAVTWGK